MVSDLLPAEILTIIDAVSTAVLAVITYFYAKETGLIRKLRSIQIFLYSQHFTLPRVMVLIKRINPPPLC